MILDVLCYISNICLSYDVYIYIEAVAAIFMGFFHQCCNKFTQKCSKTSLKCEDIHVFPINEELYRQKCCNGLETDNTQDYFACTDLLEEVGQLKTIICDGKFNTFSLIILKSFPFSTAFPWSFIGDLEKPLHIYPTGQFSPIFSLFSLFICLEKSGHRPMPAILDFYLTCIGKMSTTLLLVILTPQIYTFVLILLYFSNL